MNKQTVFVIVLVAVLGATGYLWYGYFNTAPAGGGRQGSGAERLAQVSRLSNIQLDTSLFADPFFSSLAPPQVIPQPDVAPGRVNPFVPF